MMLGKVVGLEELTRAVTEGTARSLLTAIAQIMRLMRFVVIDLTRGSEPWPY